MCQKPIPYKHRSTDTVSVSMETLSLALGLSSSTSTTAQRWPVSTLMPGWLQGDVEDVHYLITKGNSPPLQGVLMSPVFLLPVSVSPFAVGLCVFYTISLLDQIATAEQL